MEKCIILGYSDGYKGWKFYNPTSKHTLISERADFNERYFPMSKRSSLPSQPPPTASTTVPTSHPVEYYNPGVTHLYPLIPGSNYLKVFAPTVHLSSIQVILALAALQDLHLYSLDISYAYLNGEMDCEVYMVQPEGFMEGDLKAKVCLLQKAIYGSKQGGNCWNKTMCSVLESLDFSQTYSNASIYIYSKDNVTIILPVFVLNMMLASNPYHSTGW